MKRATLGTAMLSLAIGHCFGQGQIIFDTYGLGPSGFIRFSNILTEAWTSEDVVGGLYWGEDPASVGNLLLPLAPIQGPWTGADPRLWGFIIGGTLNIGRAGLPTYFQVKAWSVGFESWETAMASGDPSVLVNVLEQSPIAIGYPSISSGPPPPGIPWGGTRENPIIVELVPVPEPAACVLAAVGGCLLAWRGQWRRRNGAPPTEPTFTEPGAGSRRR